MSKVSFDILPENGGIVVNRYLNGYKISLLLDTGASNTLIDLNLLLLADIPFKDLNKILSFKTASGKIEANFYKIENFRCLGINSKNFKFASYDFLEAGIAPAFDGMLGIDFLKNHKICIDFIHSEITVSQP